MRTLYKCALALFLIVIVSCSSVLPYGSGQSHVHTGPPVEIGERYHAAMEYNPDLGKITIFFYNPDERSVEIFDGHKVKGEVEFGGTKNVLYFAKGPKAGRFVPTDYSTNRIQAKADWLRNLPGFTLKARLPIRGSIYEQSFVYSKEA